MKAALLKPHRLWPVRLRLAALNTELPAEWSRSCKPYRMVSPLLLTSCWLYPAGRRAGRGGRRRRCIKEDDPSRLEVQRARIAHTKSRTIPIITANPPALHYLVTPGAGMHFSIGTALAVIATLPNGVLAKDWESPAYTWLFSQPLPIPPVKEAKM